MGADAPVLLIVDDVEHNRAILSEMFRGRFEILEACDAQEALRLIERHRARADRLRRLAPGRHVFGIVSHCPEMVTSFSTKWPYRRSM